MQSRVSRTGRRNWFRIHFPLVLVATTVTPDWAPSILYVFGLVPLPRRPRPCPPRVPRWHSLVSARR
jgi:hypothetical protein